MGDFGARARPADPVWPPAALKSGAPLLPGDALARGAGVVGHARAFVRLKAREFAARKKLCRRRQVGVCTQRTI